MHHIRETRPREQSVGSGSELWCEVCETDGHDIMTCTNMFAGKPGGGASAGLAPSSSKPAEMLPAGTTQRTGKDAVIQGLQNLSINLPHPEDIVPPLSPGRKPAPDPAGPVAPPAPAMSTLPNPNDTGMVAGKSSGVVDPAKWCALCERDGHESVDCPFEDAF
jgi:hypothetical protein